MFVMLAFSSCTALRDVPSKTIPAARSRPSSTATVYFDSEDRVTTVVGSTSWTAVLDRAPKRPQVYPGMTQAEVIAQVGEPSERRRGVWTYRFDTEEP